MGMSLVERTSDAPETYRRSPACKVRASPWDEYWARLPYRPAAFESEAAERLGIHRTSIYDKMRRYGIEYPQPERLEQ